MASRVGTAQSSDGHRAVPGARTGEPLLAGLELEPASLRRTEPPDRLGFTSTQEVEPLQGTVGQARADEAIAFGLDAEASGYNVFVTGPVGVGKRTSLESHLNACAARRSRPPDQVYLHNFGQPQRPLVVALVNGQARRLVADMRQFLDDARRELTTAFESDTYAHQQRELIEPLEQAQEQEAAELREQGRARGIAVEFTPTGIVTVPVHRGEPMTPAEFNRLPQSARERHDAALAGLSPAIQAFVADMRMRQRQIRDGLRDLEREVALFAVGHLIDDLKARYAEVERLAGWFDAVQEDVIENLPHFRGAGAATAAGLPAGFAEALGGAEDRFASRYEVNVFVSHEGTGAPVVIETSPTYANVFGRIEHRGVLGGGFVTDHRMLRPGAIHRANGGYLLLQAADVLADPLLWRKLKEVLRTEQVRLENPADQYALFPMETLSPEPIPLDVKVVLVGSPALYELAYALDEDLRKLFRVKAEFDWRMPWDQTGVSDYMGFLSAHVRRDGLRDFDAGAAARVVEHGGRLADSREWLSTRFVDIAGLAAEASHWASRDGSDLVRAEHVERAIEQRVRRSDLVERRLLEMVRDGTLLLDVEGEQVGQVNGLAVLALGDYAFGRPVRITATTGAGRSGLLSIERETELSGHVHDKGFLILSGYLRRRYGGEQRLALAASLAFEQEYDRIDGDSAASAELYALLSSLADVPLRQDAAVTGSVNQRGELQAIGGVNEKIEGFYRACRLRGLTGHQGVIIPAANRANLMLSPEVVESVRAGAFHVWAARTVEEGVALLTGLPAGERGADGRYPEGSVHARVAARLEGWAAVADSAGHAEE